MKRFTAAMAIIGFVVSACNMGNTTTELDGRIYISGPPVVGQQLSVRIGDSVSDNYFMSSFQWKRGEADIGTESFYIVKPDDVDSLISVTVGFTRHSGDIIYDYAGSLTSDPVGPVVKASFTKQIYIRGIVALGEVLTADTSELNGEGPFAYQWKRGETEIGTGETYTIQADDLGQTISVTVTQPGYFSTSESLFIPPALTGTVTINGTIEVGHRLTLDTSALDGEGIFSYQWMSGETEVGTESAYTLLISDVGSRITVTVTRSDRSGSITSDPTDAVINGVPVAPAGVNATATSTNSITVNWASVSNAAGYHVYRRSSSGEYEFLITVTSTSYTDTGLSRSTSYYYIVSAYNDIGEGVHSAVVTARTYGPPDPPGSLTASYRMVGGAYAADLSWSAVAGATSYKVYSASIASGTYRYIGTTTSTGFYGWPPNVSGDRYYYAVTAVNSYGESGMRRQR